MLRIPSRWMAPGLAAVAVLALSPQATATSSPPAKEVGSGETWTVSSTTRLSKLVVDQGGTIAAPAGDTVTLTVNGVETGQKLTATGGTDTTIQPGTYRGDVVLTVSTENAISFSSLVFPLRQALYVGSSGPVSGESVLSAVRGGRVGSSSADGVTVRSTGEAFNGLYVDGGTYALNHSRINLVGNGRSDFIGDGAAVTADNGSRLVLDGAHIDNTGAVRTGVVAEGGSNVLVKNSTISTHDGTLPSDYTPTVDTTYMESAPWMLGIVGNVRATNLLGTDTKAAYVNSSISSTGWGALSTDNGSDGHLTAIDSRVTTTKEGYGSYVIGNATEEFLGDRLDVASYAAINRGGSVHYGDSTRSAVAALNSSDSIGLSARELASLPVRATVIHSKRFGIMWHGSGSASIDGHTQLDTRETTFLDKGQEIDLTVDGSQGAQVRTGNGVLFQLMNDDDPGPVMVNGKLVNEGVYTEPTTAPTKDTSFDTTTAQANDAHATFTDTTLNGDFYNGYRDDKNLDLTFDGSRVTGVISSSTTKHHLSTITSADYKQMGEVTDTASAAVNNGVIVDLSGRSVWTVTGTSYLTSLTVGNAAKVVGAHGKHVTVTVDGTPTTLRPGHTYTGQIVVSTH